MTPKAHVARHGSSWLVETFPVEGSPTEMHAVELLAPVTFRKDVAQALDLSRGRLDRYRRGIDPIPDGVRDRIRRFVVSRALASISREIDRLREEPWNRDFVISDIYCYSAALSVITEGRYSFLNTEKMTTDDVVKGCGW